MNNLEKLKKEIENKSISDELIIFELSDIDFVALQYIEYIAKIKNQVIEYLSSIESLFSANIFGETEFNDLSIKVHRCDRLSELNELIFSRKNVIIITNRVEKSIKDQYTEYIYEIPKLEDWQIKDYVYSTLEGIDQKKLDILIEKCKNNIYRLDNEISKICIFNEAERLHAFNSFLDDNIFSDISKYSIFDFTNAIIKKDFETLKSIYNEKENIDIEPLGVVTILLNSFRDIITLQFDPRLTPETSGIQKSRFWAIKYSCGYYTNDKLIEIFKLLCDIDKKIKTGTISIDILIDYLLINILN